MRRSPPGLDFQIAEIDARSLVRGLNARPGRTEDARIVTPRPLDVLQRGMKSEAYVPPPRLRGISHLLGFVAALPLGVLLTVTVHGLARAAAIAFAVSVVSMFGVSSLFHRVTFGEVTRRRLGLLDHTMIFGLIAGTYAPIGLLTIGGEWRTPVLATAWGATLAAVIVKLAWRGAPAWVMPVLCIMGGLAYTGGAIVYTRRRPDPFPATFGFHEVFHLLVVVAVACQYASVAFFVLPRA
jgi:hemolysin III